MTNKITDLQNQQQPEQHTSSIIKDLDQLRTLSMEELNQVVGGIKKGKKREYLMIR